MHNMTMSLTPEELKFVAGKLEALREIDVDVNQFTYGDHQFWVVRGEDSRYLLRGISQISPNVPTKTPAKR